MSRAAILEAAPCPPCPDGLADAGGRRFGCVGQACGRRTYGMRVAGALVTELQERHARYYLGFVEDIEPQINTANRATAVGLLDVEHDNLRASRNRRTPPRAQRRCSVRAS
jgi:hypothetical protein